MPIRWASGAARSGNLGDLEPRLLAVVIDGTASATSTRGSPATERCTTAATATSGRRRKPTSPGRPRKSGPRTSNQGPSCAYIAEYLYHGLGRHDRAIEILLDAHHREVLDEAGQSHAGRCSSTGRQPLRRVNPDPGAAGRSPAGQPRLPRAGSCMPTSRPKQPAAACGPAQEDRRIFPPGESLAGERHGQTGPELPGE